MALVLALATAISRIPLRTRYLLNWDAVQFALGLRSFDIAHHQPHPPGYPLYLAMARAALPLLGDANSALVALSITGEAAAVAGVYLFARSLFGGFAGIVSAAALAASPLFWYCGEAANTYALEPALALAVVWFAWRAWNGERRAALPAAVVLAAAGGVRPSLAVLVAPLVILSVVRLRSARLAAAAAGAAIAVTLLWLVPLTILAGGPFELWRASTLLGSDVTGSTAIWRAGLPGLRTTAEATSRGVAWELGAFSVIALFGLLVAPRLGARTGVPRTYWAFAAAWAVPALLTFLLVHIGQLAYVQVFTPALVLVLGPATTATARALGRPAWAPAVAAVAAAAGVVVFLVPPQTSLAGQLRRHDQAVAGLVELGRAEDPGRTVLVTDAYAAGSYRTAQVYLPAYHRVALARDRSGLLGEMFGDDYTPERFESGAGELALPTGADTFVFLDRATVDSYVADSERLAAVRLGGGVTAYIWRGAAPRVRGGQLWLGPSRAERRGLAA